MLYTAWTQAKQLIVGCSQVEVQVKVRELLRPFFPFGTAISIYANSDAEFTKLSISGMLATRISYINDLAVVRKSWGLTLLQYVREWLPIIVLVQLIYLQAQVLVGKISHDILTLANTVANTGVKSQLLS